MVACMAAFIAVLGGFRIAIRLAKPLVCVSVQIDRGAQFALDDIGNDGRTHAPAQHAELECHK